VRFAAALAAATLASACASVAPPAAGPPRGVRTDTLRVLTFNIAHGLGSDERLNLDRAARVISAALPDLVALQEVDSATARTERADQPARLARFTRMDAYFARAMPYDGGAYGVAILSDLPVTSFRTHALPAAEGHEPRAVAEARIALPNTGDTIVFLSTHLDHTSGNDVRQRQAERIAELFPADDSTVAILAGDLNDVPASRTLDALLLDWRDGTGLDHPPTYPARTPERKIDYVLYRPSTRVRVLESFVLAERTASDHRPVLVVLEVSSRCASPNSCQR
jgi:endonuclease/exonuclease/phosphatase family metal-dependent hydrolase